MANSINSLFSRKKSDNSMARAAMKHVKKLPLQNPPDDNLLPDCEISGQGNAASISAASASMPVKKSKSAVKAACSVQNLNYALSAEDDDLSPTVYINPASSAIEAALKAEFSDKTQHIMMIPTSEIIPNPMQPRRTFSDEAIARLADSIRRHGIIQPLTVRPLESPAAGYELIAGERRLRAAKLIGMERVPCIVSSADSSASAQIAIVENIQREDLNMFEEAIAIAAIMKLHCLTQEKIASELSCSQSYVANKLRLLKLSPEDMELIIESGLTERHARAFLRIKDENLRRRAINTVIRRKMNVASADEYIDSLLCPKQEEKSGGGKTTVILKDLRIFHNTLDKALDFIKKAGVPVETVRTEDAAHTEILIRLPRQ